MFSPPEGEAAATQKEVPKKQSKALKKPKKGG
jgi:hypothetical protein